MDTLELIENIRAGRDVQSSQAILYLRVCNAIQANLVPKVRGRVRARLDADDVVHEAFLRAMENLDGYKVSTERAFYGWVHTIAKNLLIDCSKRRSLGAIPFASEDDESGIRASDIADDDVGDHVDAALPWREAVEKLFARLRPADAELIRWRRLDGLSYNEISERLQKSTGAVQRAYSRAWQNLLEVAGKAGAEELE
ncbi:MAG: RNA polymerase sigma factor [Planctomycetota bacterium]